MSAVVMALGPEGGLPVWSGWQGWGLATLLGMIPGCAPLLVMGGLHVAGAVPLPMLAYASVLTDGDASAPVIWSAPKAWLLASVLAIPGALIAAFCVTAFF